LEPPASKAATETTATKNPPAMAVQLEAINARVRAIDLRSDVRIKPKSGIGTRHLSAVRFHGCSRPEALRYHEGVKLTIELDREDDGRWIAEVIELPGAMCYGKAREEAIGNAERLAIEVIADRIAHDELPSSALAVSFTVPDERLARK
jgi:predicted RNase H-like HicB family nuclease